MSSYSDYCKNCNQHLLLNQKFCHNCGQKADTHRIDFHFLMHELQHGVFHVDGGIFYTLKCLFTKPGYSIKAYLEGKRQAHFKPVMLVVFLGTLCGLLQHYLGPEAENNEKNINIQIGKAKEKTESLQNVDVKGFLHYLEGVFEWFSGHYAFTVLAFIPIAALAFFIGFRSAKLYYAEWLVYMCFSAGQALVVYFLFLILSFIFYPQITDISILFILGLSLWTIIEFFNYKNPVSVFFKSVWSFFLYFLFAIIIISVFSMLVFYIGYLKFVS